MVKWLWPVTKQAHNSSPTSKVHSDILLNIQIASLIPFPLLKSKLTSKHTLNFLFHPSSKYPHYYLCCMCNEADCEKVTAFCNFWLLKAIIVTSMQSLGHSPVSHVVDQLETTFPQQSENIPRQSSPAAFLFLISLIDYSNSLCKMYGPFSSASISSSTLTSRSSVALAPL